MAVYNNYSFMPMIPYHIMEYLAYNNDNIWKILKYGDYDCLSKPNLTFKEKMSMVWKQQGDQQNYHVFLTYLVENMIPESTTILKLFRYNTMPESNIKGYSTYEFNLLYGGKISLIEHQGVPCSRGDVLESEIISTLNGKDVGGVGTLQFNAQVSPVSRSQLNLGNNKTYEGVTIMMGVRMDDIGGTGVDACG